MTPSNVNENDALYLRIRSGDKPAIAEMIERNTPLVKSRVGGFLKDRRRFRHLFDDLLGVGFLALAEVVNSFKESEVSKPTGRIVSEIDFALGNYIDHELGEGMMRARTVQRRREKNESIPKRLPIDLAAPPARLWRNASGRVVRKQIEDENGPAAEMPELEQGEFGVKSKVGRNDAEQLIAYFQAGAPHTDLLDTILGCCESEDDKAIVELRNKGFSDKEIGEQRGMSRQAVYSRRYEIEKRFNERTKKPGQ